MTSPLSPPEIKRPALTDLQIELEILQAQVQLTDDPDQRKALYKDISSMKLEIRRGLHEMVRRHR